MGIRAHEQPQLLAASASALLLVGSFFVPGGAPAAGWTIYAPLTVQMGMGMDMGIFALHSLGAVRSWDRSTSPTILNIARTGHDADEMPMFAWTWLITAYLLIAVCRLLRVRSR